eukprot:5487052-Pleurochrysis_carterae.AAC.1
MRKFAVRRGERVLALALAAWWQICVVAVVLEPRAQAPIDGIQYACAVSAGAVKPALSYSTVGA